MHFVQKTGEFYNNLEELGLFQDKGMEEYLARARGHVEAMLIVEEIKEVRKARDKLLFQPDAPPRDKPLPLFGEKHMWKLRAQLIAQRRDELVGVLEENKGEFSFSPEEWGKYKGEPLVLAVAVLHSTSIFVDNVRYRGGIRDA